MIPKCQVFVLNFILEGVKIHFFCKSEMNTIFIIHKLTIIHLRILVLDFFQNSKVHCKGVHDIRHF